MIPTVDRNKKFDLYAAYRGVGKMQTLRPSLIQTHNVQSPLKRAKRHGSSVARRAGSVASMASGTGSIISAISSEQLRRLDQRERDRTVLVKQKELR